MSDGINQEKSITLYCVNLWVKKQDLQWKYQQNIKNAGLGKKKTTVKGKKRNTTVFNAIIRCTVG